MRYQHSVLFIIDALSLNTFIKFVIGIHYQYEFRHRCLLLSPFHSVSILFLSSIDILYFIDSLRGDFLQILLKYTPYGIHSSIMTWNYNC